MRLLVLFHLFIISSPATFAQHYYDYNFEDTIVGVAGEKLHELLFVDTISNSMNIWQIGAPQKNVFTSAISLPNAIVTDTNSSYPTNDTSSFILKHIAGHGFSIGVVLLSGSYYVDSDTLTDYGMIEFSPDKGGLWLDILNDSILGVSHNWNYGTLPKPTFSGSSNGWVDFHFSLDISGFTPVAMADTVLWRFSFISDGIQTNSDGLMFDNIGIGDAPPVGLTESVKDQPRAYPNPCLSMINVEFENPQRSLVDVVVYTSIGAVLERAETSNSSIVLNTVDYCTGEYFVKVFNSKGNLISVQNFIRQ